MILTCPNCQTSYGLDPGSGVAGKFLCRRCQTTFLTTSPEEESGDLPASETGQVQVDGKESRKAVVAVEPGGFRDHLCRILEDRSVTIRVTSDGEAALALVRRENPGFLFTAVYLRRLLGITLCERVRELSEASGIRVILIGHARTPQPGGNQVTGRFGEDFYLEDHLTRETLAARIDEIVRDETPQPAPPEAVVPVEAAVLPSRPPGITEETESEICKLGRIAAEDLLLYNPAKGSACHHSDEIEKLFSMEIRQGKALVKERYPDVPEACDIFLRSLKENLLRAGSQGGMDFQ